MHRIEPEPRHRTTFAEPSSRLSSNCATVPARGTIASGAISLRGIRTKRARPGADAESPSPGSPITSSPKSRMSRSSVRGPLRMPTARSRPNSFSIASKLRRSSFGSSSVSRATTALQSGAARQSRPARWSRETTGKSRGPGIPGAGPRRPVLASGGPAQLARLPPIPM